MKAGKVKLENRYDFLNLNQFDLQWQLLKDGQIVESGVLSLGDAAPNKDIEVTIPYKTALDAGSEYFLNLSARLKKDCNWANAGHEVASEQYSLTGKIAVAPVDTAFNDTLKVEEEKEQIGFRAPGFFIAFNPETGKMVSLRYAGTDMIYNKEGFDFNWFRAMDNDKRDYLPTTVKKQAFDWKQATDKKSVTITTSLEATVGSGTQKVVLPFDVTYTVYANGTVDVDATFKAGNDFNLPRLGLQVALNPTLEQVEWYGRGPIENYWDRKAGYMIGQYKSTAEEQYFPYVRPQENGHHCDTRWISLGGKGKNLLIVADDEMEFNAMRNSVEDFDAGKATDRPYQWNNFTPEEIANRPEIGPYDKPRQTHINDIAPRNFVEVCVDLKQQGLAGYDSWYSRPEPEYTLPADREYKWGFTLIPGAKANSAQKKAGYSYK